MMAMHFDSSKGIITAAAIGAALLVGGFVGGIYIAKTDNIPAPVAQFYTSHLDVPPAGANLTPVWRAWNILNEKFVPASTTKVASEQDKVWGLISGLTASLGDPYTVFFPPQESAIFQQDISGSFEGVGMEIGIRDGTLAVVSPLKGSPALRAGLKAGDKMLKINGTSTESMPVDKAVQLIRGKKGTTVTFTIAREEEKEFIEIKVVRDVIDIPTIETKEQNGVFVISLYNFSAVAPNLFREALRAFVVSGTNKLVLDLRGNPGGYLEASVDMASWFLPSGKIVVTEDMGGNGKPSIHRSRGYDVFSNSLRMAILIDNGSASASEILAGALQEHGIAKLVGEHTFGKGSVQELVSLIDKASLKVTVARWFTPNGRSISDGGLKPDIEVKRTQEDVKAEKDPQLNAAIKLLNQE